MRISVEEAREYFADPSQRPLGIDPADLPAEGFEYWAIGPVCWIFHPAPWPGIWMSHFAVKPEGRGHAVEAAKAIAHEFWAEKKPVRLIGWTPERNRAALAFTRRIGAVRDGVMPTPTGNIIMQGWVPDGT